MLLLSCVLASLMVCLCDVEGQSNPANKGHLNHEVLSKLMVNNPDLVPVNPELLAAVSEQLRAAHTEPPPPESLANPELSALAASSALLPEPPLPNSTVLPHSPQFVVRLPDKNLLCFSIDGFELFTYNLITSNYLVLNGFLNLTSIPAVDGFTQKRGFGDIGMIIKAVDRRVKAGKRYFKHLIYGERKKAIMQGFGEVDMNGGAVTFSVRDGHSNIESQQSAHEQFRLKLDKPQTDIVIISSNGHTFDVYVEDITGLIGIEMHGLIGKLPTIPVHNRSSKLCAGLSLLLLRQRFLPQLGPHCSVSGPFTSH